MIPPWAFTCIVSPIIATDSGWRCASFQRYSLCLAPTAAMCVRLALRFLP
eukprot:CAMPEP_0172925706 /NCGR_PEP_ID=MMETSP1075-20121228/214204_1 /TAXON_ID=2916 /ORGANISM="Ceratium fusus, Strain PA161109" /LENGTH=49 /DNA_ID=CAMNT_0013786635 /DNA_START=107 /DNA_END=253 /DNA_ORIENTATION=+